MRHWRHLCTCIGEAGGVSGFAWQLVSIVAGSLPLVAAENVDDCVFIDGATPYCMYTNADSLMNKFIEFKERVKMNNCLVIGITEVKPKNQRFINNLAELALENYDNYVPNKCDRSHWTGSNFIYS